METIALFEEKVPITPRDLSRDTINIDGLLLKKLATKLEGRCSLHGWVKPGSMKILSRSMGYVEKGRFTGDIVYHVQSEGTVVNPPSGVRVVGDVIRKNKMGMYVNYNDAVRIILPRDLHLGDQAYDNIDIGERVHVEVKKSRFQVNDEYILSVGLFQGRVGEEEKYQVPRAEEESEDEKLEVEAKEKEVPPAVKEEEEEEEEEEEVAETPVGEQAANQDMTPIELTSKSTDFQELSNAFIAPFTADGKEWRSVEHYFQAMKFPSDPAYQEQIRLAPKPANAKTLGASADKPVRPDWDQYREEVMRKALRSKFTDPKNQVLLEKLLATGNRPIVEASSADSYWGQGKNKKGKNRLGSMLMELRAALRAERKGKTE